MVIGQQLTGDAFGDQAVFLWLPHRCHSPQTDFRALPRWRRRSRTPRFPRLRVVSNFGDGDCGAGKIHTRARELETTRSLRFPGFSPDKTPTNRLQAG